MCPIVVSSFMSLYRSRCIRLRRLVKRQHIFYTHYTIMSLLEEGNYEASVEKCPMCGEEIVTYNSKGGKKCTVCTFSINKGYVRGYSLNRAIREHKKKKGWGSNR